MQSWAIQLIMHCMHSHLVLWTHYKGICITSLRRGERWDMIAVEHLNHLHCTALAYIRKCLMHFYINSSTENIKRHVAVEHLNLVHHFTALAYIGIYFVHFYIKSNTENIKRHVAAEHLNLVQHLTGLANIWKYRSAQIAGEVSYGSNNISALILPESAKYNKRLE